MRFFMEMYGDIIFEVIVFAGLAAIMLTVVLPFAIDIVGNWCL